MKPSTNMKRTLPSFARATLPLALLQLGLLLCPVLRADVVFTVTPAAVSNTYTGAITLQVSGLTNNEEVVVQKFLDLNKNGVVDAGDWLAQQFNLTDGQAGMVLGGVTNFNVPGDTDTTPGQITAKLIFLNGDFMQNIAGQYLFTLSSPVGHFAPITNSFTVTNVPYPQSFTGSVVSNGAGTTVPNAVVLLFPPPRPGHNGLGGNPLAGVVADNSGSYTIPAPVGTYTPVAFKSSFLANLAASPVLTLGAGATITTNLALTNATTSISGAVVDAGNSGLGLPGILVAGQAANGFMGVGLTDSNGNFTVGVQSSPTQWSLDAADPSVIVHGYVGLNNRTSASAGQTGVALAVPKATALFYGSVMDNLGNPLTGLDVADNDNNNLYYSDGYTRSNGQYVVGVVAGLNNDWWQVGINSETSLANYLFSQPAFDSNGGTNLSANTAAQINFTAILATNAISGTVKDNSGNGVSGVGVNASATINSLNFDAYADTDANGNYSLNVANGSWDVSVNCTGGSDSLDNIFGSGNYQCPNNQSVTINNNNGAASFTVVLCGGVAITTASLPPGQFNVPYDEFLQASSCSSTFFWSLIAGSLPPGLTMNSSSGEISGTPANTGSCTFTVQVTDGNGLTADQALSLTINGGMLQVTTASLPNGTTNVAYTSQQLTASGGQPPYRWSSGALPPGLSLSTNGVMSGTPVTAGTSNFFVQVTDSASAMAVRSLSLAVYTFSTSVTFAVTPPAVSNFYTGIITLQVGGLVSGETVLVEKFRDVNSNGVIDAGDTEVQQFQLADGQASVFYDGTTAVTNFNVPGDLTPADGAITAQLHPALSGVPQMAAAQYLFRLSSLTGRFAPVTSLFNITNSTYAQSFTGYVVSGGTNVPYALAYLLAPAAFPNLTFVAGVMADGAGAYRLSAPPGTYRLLAYKGGFVTDSLSSPVLVLGANAAITTTLSLLPATGSISGRLVDAANSNAGLPRLDVKTGTGTGLTASTWADANGNFVLPVTANSWVVLGESQNLDLQGLLDLIPRTAVNATAGSVSGVTIALPRGTALFYGAVTDGQNHPLAGVRLSASQNDGASPYLGDATTDQNGNYAMPVNNAGVWNAFISGNNPAFPNYIWSAGPGDTALTNGQAAPGNFTSLLATNYITGAVKDSNNNPIGGVGVWAGATIHGADFSQYVDTDGNGNYALSVGNGNWAVGLQTSGGGDSLDSLLGAGNYQSPASQNVTINNNNGTANFTVEPAPVLQITTPSPLPAAQLSNSYSIQFQASSRIANIGPLSWSMDSGNLPSGLTLDNNGSLHGTPNLNSGTFVFSVHVSDGTGNYTADRTFTLFVSAGPLSVSTTGLPIGTNGVFYSQPLQASGGQPPYSWLRFTLGTCLKQKN